MKYSVEHTFMQSVRLTTVSRTHVEVRVEARVASRLLLEKVWKWRRSR